MTPEDTPFTLRHIEEPEIQFEGVLKPLPNEASSDMVHGSMRKDTTQSNSGIIGDRDSIRRLTELLHDMEVGIHPGTSDNPWQVPYPGLGKSSPLNLSINAKGLETPDSSTDIQSVTSKSTPKRPDGAIPEASAERHRDNRTGFRSAECNHRLYSARSNGRVYSREPGPCANPVGRF